MPRAAYPQPAEQARLDELKFLVDWGSARDRRRSFWAFLGSVAWHCGLLMLLLYAPVGWFAGSADRAASNFLRVIPIITPPAGVDPGQARQLKRLEVSLEDLQAIVALDRQRQTPEQIPALRQFQLPSLSVPAPKPAPKILEEAPPELTLGNQAPTELAGLPQLGFPATPAPVPPPKPKIRLEPPGSWTGPAQGGGLLEAVPERENPVAAAVQAMTSGQVSSGRVVLSDAGPIAMPGGPVSLPPARQPVSSSLELLSDPRGVDFRPYLIQILASVRRNWLAVIPESARLGRRGKVVIQFIIRKDGYVPKLVIASSSGSQALDRAAVAGISASHPFPPLPEEFDGNEIRVQFTFLYNMKPEIR